MITSAATRLSGASIDALFIVTSCNADFNAARPERYVAMANQAEIAPVLFLIKADTAQDAAPFVAQATGLARELPVVLVDPRRPDVLATLQPWFGPGKTVASPDPREWENRRSLTH